jgi:hypothetical protein
MKPFILSEPLVKHLKFVINYPYNKQTNANMKQVDFIQEIFFLTQFYLEPLETSLHSIEKPERYLQSIQLPIVNSKKCFPT